MKPNDLETRSHGAVPTAATPQEAPEVMPPPTTRPREADGLAAPHGLTGTGAASAMAHLIHLEKQRQPRREPE